MTALIQAYETAIHRQDIVDDPEQRTILTHLQRLTDDLTAPPSFFSFLPYFKKNIQGIYLYGPVGVGKTYLVDLCYEQLAERRKSRFHFHHFMQQIDAQLRQIQGKKNPMKYIAQEIAKQTRLLCFDEFLVHDVAYAMILSQLIQALALQGVVLLISSNTHPDNLYLHGVHRERFIPAIEAIKTHCEVLHLNQDRDYRLGRAPSFDTYLYPLNQETHQQLEDHFKHLSQCLSGEGLISIQKREIPYLQLSDHCIWFAFNVLCNVPRSSLDYLELASRFGTIFLSDIPLLTSKHSLQTLLLIHFIDVMYDQGIQVILSASGPLDDLYKEEELKEPFQRTLSRLKEMQSMDYLKRHPHRRQAFLL